MGALLYLIRYLKAYYLSTQKYCIINTTTNWPGLVKNKRFTRSLAITVTYLLLIGSTSGILFSIIQERKGFSFTDPVLVFFPSVDVSVAIFVILYILILLAVVHIFNKPLILLKGLQAYAILITLRFVCMYLVPLEPPRGMVELQDPIVNAVFYGRTVITKDLFFSGHTSTLFLLYLLTEKRALKYTLLAGSIAIIILLLIQHVHYSIDVLAAPVFSILSYQIATILSKRFSNG